MTNQFDWTHLQTFLAVAKHGSLSGAARALIGSQPTMGRHIAALENDLGVRLFERTAGGLELTPTGVELLDHARQMSALANQLSLTAEGRTEAVAGTVRITASEVMAAFVLPPIIKALHRAEPQIELELIASDQSDNLLEREADIAVRMYRPTQADVFTKKVVEVEIGLFAAKTYLQAHGTPSALTDIAEHVFIGYDRDTQIIEGFASVGIKVDRHFFPFRCDNQLVCWSMVLAGYGIGFNHLRIGLNEPLVEQLPVEIDIPKLPVWLTAHAELKTSRRVRTVFDFLAERLKQI